MVTYAVKGQRYEFELWATNVPSNSYVAVAFSNDNLMGDDSVSECTLVNGRVNAYMSFNEGKSNTRLRDVKQNKNKKNNFLFNDAIWEREFPFFYRRLMD